jgi:hypothetical protein
MQIIKVTSLSSKKPIYININMIGHFFEVEETRKYNTVDKPKHTRIGVTTHNNGGFEVIESVEEIAKRIINAGNGLANIIKD